MQYRPITPKNDGWLEIFLTREIKLQIDDMIANAGKSVKSQLAGNISRSQELEPTDEFRRFIDEVIKNYQKEFDYLPRKTNVNHAETLELYDLWVNYQYATEFNPSHVHSGVYSFVIWHTIPTDIREQMQLPFAKETRAPCVSCFQFEYTSICGNRKAFNYPMSPQMDGMMLFFPAELNHLVYPFYGSTDARISLAGNVAWV